MQQRLISAAVMVPIVLVVFLLGQPWLTLGLAIVAGLAALEAARLLRSAGLPVERVLVIVVPPIAVLGLGWGGAPEGAAITFVAAVIVIAGMAGFREPDVREGFLAWAGTAFGALYVSLLAFVAGILAIAPPGALGRAADGRAQRRPGVAAGAPGDRVELRLVRVPLGPDLQAGPLPQPHLAQQDLERGHRRHGRRDHRGRACSPGPLVAARSAACCSASSSR